MLKIKVILPILIILFILERLYLIPYNVSLDMKPEGQRSATYLAETIARKAGCTISIWDTVDGIKSKLHAFQCDMIDEQASFRIVVFENIDVKKQHEDYIKKEKKDFFQQYGGYIETLSVEEKRDRKRPDTYSPCFKEGDYYRICENAGWKTPEYTRVLNGKEFYSQFPGKDIN